MTYANHVWSSLSGSLSSEFAIIRSYVRLHTSSVNFVLFMTDAVSWKYPRYAISYLVFTKNLKNLFTASAGYPRLSCHTLSSVGKVEIQGCARRPISFPDARKSPTSLSKEPFSWMLPSILTHTSELTYLNGWYRTQ